MLSKKRVLIICVALAAVIIGFSLYLFGAYLLDEKEKAELARQVEEYYAEKFRIYEEENAVFADYEVDVAFLGDSLTDGYNLAEHYPNYVTLNRGIAGETSHGLLERLSISVCDLKPKVAVMLIGGNNLGTMLDNYESLLIALRDNLPETEIVVVSLTAMGGNFAEKNKIAAYNNAVIKKLSQKYGFHFVDLFTPLLDESTGEIYSDYTSDGAHLTHLGYSVFTETLTPVLEKILENKN